jgi:hypothetical protein
MTDVQNFTIKSGNGSQIFYPDPFPAIPFRGAVQSPLFVSAVPVAVVDLVKGLIHFSLTISDTDRILRPILL